MVRKVIYLSFWIITYYAYSLNGQTYGSSFMKSADSLIQLKDFKQAQVFLENAWFSFQSNGLYDSLIHCTNQIGHNFLNKGELDSIPKRLEKDLAYFKEVEINDSFQLAKTYTLLGYSYRWTNKFIQALKAYEDAILIYKAIDVNAPGVSYTYYNAAQIYLRLLNYDKTFFYLKKGLLADSTQQFHASIYMQMAHSYYHLEQYDEVIKYAKIGQSIIQSPYQNAILNTILGGTNYKVGLLEEAKNNYEAALDYFTQNNAFWESVIVSWSGMAEIAIAKRNYPEAKLYFNEALDVLEKFGPDKSRVGAILFSNIGDFYINREDYDEALIYYQKALSQLVPDLGDQNIFNNPSKNELYPESWLLTTTSKKAYALKQKFGTSKNIKYLKLASETYNIALAEISLLVSTYGTEKSKLFIGNYGKSHFESALETQFHLYQQTKDNVHLEEIFQLIERPKASLLRAALQRNRAKIIANIPDSIIVKEEKLRLDQANIAKQLAKEALHDTKGDGVLIEHLQDDLQENEEAYTQFIKQLQKNFPNYQRLTQADNIPTIPAIQAYLAQEDAILLSYFWGKEQLYLLAISKDDIQVIQLGNTSSLSTKLSDLLPYIRDKQSFAKDPGHFFDLAHQMYQALGLESLLAQQKGKKLLVIADGPLHYLPFETLITTSQRTKQTRLPDYLLVHHPIAYHYTTATVLPSQNERVKNGKLLAIFPQFLQGERGLAALNYGKEETGNIRPHQRLTYHQASLAEFLQNAGAYPYLHLSTHAEANPELAVPRIELIDSTLFLPEIYALNLQTDLVVLSACETGTGKLESGEGIMSLARAFSFAGVSSLVSSLWQVNEQSTAQLFATFYNELDQGKNKSTALQAAKLNYLQNADSDLAMAPYYWAGFVFYGQDGKVSFAPNWPKGLLVGMGILLFGGIGMTIRSYRSAANKEVRA